MSVRQNNDGSYEVQVWYKDNLGARHKKHKRGFKKKSDAVRWEAEFLLKASGSPQMLFRDFVDVYEADCRPQLRLNTWLNKRNIIDAKLLPFFGAMKLNEISAVDVLHWQNGLKNEVNPHTNKPYSQTYIRVINNQLSAIFNHACRYYGLKSNPLGKVGKAGKETTREMQFWVKDEYLAFADAVMDKPTSFTAFECLYWLGIREGELLALRPSDFDFEKSLLRITRSYQRLQGKDIITPPKTPRSIRTIAVPDFLAEEILEYINLNGIQEDDRLLKITKYYLYAEMQRGCKAAGVKKIRVHDLRHSHVSLLIDLGFSALAIADRMGHEAVDITYRYAHLFPTVQADMARALESEKGDDIHE